MICGLLYVGFAVENVNATRRTFKGLFGLPGEHMPADPFLGTDQGARLAFPNECWLYVMESQQPDSPVRRYINSRGPGLERVAFLSDDIESEFQRVQKAGMPLDDKALVATPWGQRFFVPGEFVSGVGVEVIQPAPAAWEFGARTNCSGVLSLQHIGVAVRDVDDTCDTFARLFDLQPGELRTDQHEGEQKDVMIEPGNDRLWLHVTQSWGENARVRQFLDEKGEGLEHLCIEVDDIRAAVNMVASQGVPLVDHKIFTNRPDGFEAFVRPEHSTGVTVELIEPYPSSRGYRERR